MAQVFGAEFRRVEDRDYRGKPAMVIAASRIYETTVADLWDAMTSKERIVRWFTPIEGELTEGGRYQLTGNAEGTIERCDPPDRLELTWEFAGTTSWVHVQLSSDVDGAKLVLEHIAHKDSGPEEHFLKYGPGAGGVGWDLSFYGLERHLANPDRPASPEEDAAWMASEEAKTFVRYSGKAWGEAHAASGADAAEATAMAERTIAFYTGAEH